MPFAGTSYLLNKKCNVQRASVTTNAKNQKVTGALTSVYTDLPCRLFTKSGKRIIEGKLVTVSDHVLFTGYGKDIRESDVITIATKKYQVEFVTDNPGDSGHHQEVLLSLLES